MAEFRLSTLDQNAPRTYLRHALCFSSNDKEPAVIAERLQRAAKSLVSEIPILAGTITINAHKKPSSVTVTPTQVKEFAAVIKHLDDHAQSYQDIYQSGFAPRHLEDIGLDPLANDLKGEPSCAIQANFFDGGLILVIYLHHAVAGINGMSTILRLISEELPPRKLNNDELKSEAIVVSRARSRLSHGFGAPAFLTLARGVRQRQEQSTQRRHKQIYPVNGDGTVTASDNNNLNATSCRSAIFVFRLEILLQTTEMLNSRRILRVNSRNSATTTTDSLSPREVLIAILWQAYTRARYRSSPIKTGRTHNDDLRTSISFPLDLRPTLISPLSTHWLGNASLPAYAASPFSSLLTPTNLSTLEHTASIIYTAASAQNSDLLIRSRINLLNSSAAERDWAPTPQLVMHDWASSVPSMMEGQVMDLGLGVGMPDAVRRIGREVDAGDEVVLLPVNRRTGVWEVPIEVQERSMRSLVNDEGLRPWLWGVFE